MPKIVGFVSSEDPMKGQFYLVFIILMKSQTNPESRKSRKVNIALQTLHVLR